MKAKASIYFQARDVAVEAARLAGAFIQTRAGRLEREDVRSKGRHDLVTDVDLGAQRIVIETIRQVFPDHALLAEEEDDLAAGPASEFRWIIDPIDGTTNFTRGVPPYAVSIALEHAGEIVVGVVLDVPRGELFTALRGGGLYVDGVRHGVSAAPTLDESLVTTGFPYRSLDHLEAYLDVLGRFMRRARGVRRPGSAAIDLAYVACGRFDGFFETGLGPWDVAAGRLLVEEGGGRVTDLRGGPDVVFARQILATNGHVHDEMLELVAPLRDAFG